MRIDGNFDEVRRKLEELQKNLAAIQEQQVPMAELLDPAFLLAHTEFTSLEELFGSGGFNVSSQEDFEQIPPAQLDHHVALHTEFASWSELTQAAAQEWVARRLGLDE